MGVPAIPTFLKLEAETYLRRLFSTFARGKPGIGIVILRLVVGIAFIMQSAHELQGTPSLGTLSLTLLGGGIGLLVLVGLWTPVTATLVALIELSKVPSHWGEHPAYILLAAIGVALALVGPGFWSVDARLYGWKRIDSSPRLP